MKALDFSLVLPRLTAVAAAAMLVSFPAMADDSTNKGNSSGDSSKSTSSNSEDSKKVATSSSDDSKKSTTSDSESSKSSKSSDDGSKSNPGSSDDGKGSDSKPTVIDGTVSGNVVSDGLKTAATSGTVSPVQSPADPMGLKIVDQTRLAGSDAASANFQKNLLPTATDFILKTLPETQNNSAVVKAMPLDPSKLVLATTENVRAYFVFEGAGYANTLGFNTTGTGVKDGDPKIIFPNASSSVGPITSGQTGERTANEPLLPGDFVNLGVMKAGTKLDFFLLADGANGGTTAWSTSGNNPDGINHVASLSARMFAIPNINSPYLFIAFEDLWGGGDKDYNDAVFAINVGAATINRLVATPEPATWASLACFLVLAVYVKRRQDSRRATAH